MVEVLEEKDGCVKFLYDNGESQWLQKKVFEKRYGKIEQKEKIEQPAKVQEKVMVEEEKEIPITQQKYKHQSIVGFGKEREENDFYPTPRIGTNALLERESFEGTIWECASGDGSMSKFLEERYREVYSSDIRTDEEIYGNKGIDFLKKDMKVDNIITNPPYRYAKEFIEHALNCANKKVCMLLKLVFLESVSRYELFKNSPLKYVYVFCKRLPIYKKGIVGKNSGLIAYAWFVWEKGYKGEPIIRWIR